MELLYVWIEGNENIKGQSFNFSQNNYFDFNEKDKKLNIKELNIPKNLFSKKITNITALIGKNGSGKSNFLEILIEKPNFEGFMIKKSKDKLFVYYSSKLSDYMQKLGESLQLFFSISNIQLFGFSNTKRDNLIGFSEHSLSTEHRTSLVYYSPVFSDRDFGENASNFFITKNVSTNYLVKNIFHRNISEYFSNDTKNIINFLTKYDFHKNFSKDFSINFPEEMTFKIKRNGEKEKEFKEYGEDNKIFNKLNHLVFVHHPIFGKNIKVTNKDRFKYRLLQLFYVLSSDKFSSGGKIKKKLDTIKFDEENNSFEHIYKCVLEDIENIVGLENKNNYINTITNNISFIESLNEEYFTNNISIDINIKENAKKILNWLENNKDNTIEDHYFEYKWRNISSGEEAILNLFSRFNSALEKIGNKNNILLVIDEGELYFHPEWQRQYITCLINMIELIMPNDSKTQIILTSHSSFVIADLPKENIILLGKEKSDLKETFGSNIHSLLANEFFMTSTIGAFAKSKIDEVLEILNREDIEEINKKENYINYIIKIIGEPIIKNKLRKMLSEKLTPHLPENKEREIKLLRERIEKLEQLNNSHNRVDNK